MNVPKLSPAQWFKLVVSLLPFIRALVKVTGMGVVAVIRTLIDLIAEVESLFPPALDADGKPIKRGAEKAQAFADLVAAAFATADESAAAVQARVGDIGQAGAVIVSLFNQWKLFSSMPEVSRA